MTQLTRSTPKNSWPDDSRFIDEVMASIRKNAKIPQSMSGAEQASSAKKPPENGQGRETR